MEDFKNIILKKLMKEYPNAGCELRYHSVFELLIAVILSAQCTDVRVNKITPKLFAAYNTPYQFAQLSSDDLIPYIFSCGFFNTKSNNIIKTSKIIVEKHEGSVPNDMESLIALPGVGRKTAQVVLAVGFGYPSLPVDTHVYRVSRRIGLSKSNSTFDVEMDLKKAYDIHSWNDLHHALIAHGRNTCSARKPKCETCVIKDHCMFLKNNY